jgi:hypothetical protein
MTPMSSLNSSEDGGSRVAISLQREAGGVGSLDVGGPVELLIWRSASSLEAAPMWVSPTQFRPKSFREIS